MPRPHLTSHLSLQRFRSNVSTQSNTPTTGLSRNPSPVRTFSEKSDLKGDLKGMNLVLRVQVLKVYIYIYLFSNDLNDSVAYMQL